MTTHNRQVIVALDGKPIGHLKALGNAYEFSYISEYQESTANIPLSYSYPLQQGPWPYAFAGDLPPYFFHLLPEGWLKDIAETAHLPMETPLEKLVTLCGENIGAVEILSSEASLERTRSSLSLFQLADQPKADYPSWRNCVRCHEELPSKGYNSNFHDDCSFQFFGSKQAPSINIDSEALEQIALDQLRRHESLTGVQPKFSAIFRKSRGSLADTSYIVKPQPNFERVRDGITYEHSSIAELAAMHFAELLELQVAETALVYLAGNQPALVSKRFDRNSKGKVHIEDAAQALGLRYKYTGSHEKIAAVIRSFPDLEQRSQDMQRFLKVILLNFVIGNSDGHLKNFSFNLQNESGMAQISLSPFYDILPIKLFAKNDPDQLGLTVNGKKNKLSRLDFQQLTIRFGLKISVFMEFVEEMEVNIPAFYETFTMFDAPSDMIERLKEYCENQLAVLKK